MQKFGIDISHWQGDISVASAKAERPVEFVIIKLGGADAGRYKDSKFDNYYNQCKAIGMPCGAYYFGNAYSNEDASSEADHFIQLLAGKQFEYPVYYDVEAGMLKNSKDNLTEYILTFCEKVEAAGYFVGVYSSDSHFISQMDDSRLQKFTHWVAKYSSKSPSTGHDIWQFGGESNFLFSNQICGRTVDQDYCYRDFEAEIKAAGLNGFSAETAAPTPTPSKSIDEIANEVLAGRWGNGIERTNALTASGYDANAVQNRVNEIWNEQNAPKPVLKSTDEVANEVLAGRWGNGVDRKNALEAAGYNYNEVQGKVDELWKVSQLLPLDEIAKQVLQGKWGNGQDRIDKLSAAGYNYSEVQKRVNEIC